jgi:tRNA-2-methylthio-N6-dimethylallyladenosine synthase
VGTIQRVLIEGESRKNHTQWQGRTSSNHVAVFPKQNKTKGEYVNVLIERCTSGTLIGKMVD